MYFNGFALQNEAHFFSKILDDSDYVVSGFSYGAIKAFQEAIGSRKRIDKLQLFSPAFFQNRSLKYKRLQVMGYQKDSAAYIARFSENCFSPYGARPLEYGTHDAAQLKELLEYEWVGSELQTLAEKGTSIEVYLGGEDRISDVEAAYAFFKNYATVVLIKEANHFLQGE